MNNVSKFVKIFGPIYAISTNSRTRRNSILNTSTTSRDCKNLSYIPYFNSSKKSIQPSTCIMLRKRPDTLYNQKQPQ